MNPTPTTSVFITGIGTDVGKTVVSAIVVEALQAAYWKPVQAGDLDNSDAHKVAALSPQTEVLAHSYALTQPMSPHAAAQRDGIYIDTATIEVPPTDRSYLVIEGAGGILVPLNETETIADIIPPQTSSIIVSRHYLGSINHTLATYEVMRLRNLPLLGVVFVGEPNPDTESIILSKTGLTPLLHLPWLENITSDVIKFYAAEIKPALINRLSKVAP